MAKAALNGVLHHLRKVAAVPTYRKWSDRELVERFIAEHDDLAFTVLVERHGPMVLGVCRRALANFHDAEDACQATFLVLARKAASLRKRTSLSSWLHGVACRVAASLKRDHARRRRRDRAAAAPAPRDPAAEVTWREMQSILDEELQRLPERYRVPLILCYLECLTRDEAAQQLGVSPGTLHGRLERGRDGLRQRLTKRGLTLSAVMSAAALGTGVTQAALAPTFVVSSTRAALLLAEGQPLTESAVATQVLALTQEVLKNMFLSKVKLGTAAVLCAGLFVAMVTGSFSSLGFAQDAKPVYVDPIAVQATASTPAKAESDEDFIRRISKDLRGIDPTPTEVYFFVASKEPGKRQQLIDLFIKERQAKADAATRSGKLTWAELSYFPTPNVTYDYTTKLNAVYTTNATSLYTTKMNSLYKTNMLITIHRRTSRFETLQKEFYKELQAAKDKGDVARITQTYLDGLIELVKANPQGPEAPDAMRQIVFVYESQGKTVEADAWREKLRKEHPKASSRFLTDPSGSLNLFSDGDEGKVSGSAILIDRSESAK
jgi:RNA polymerase sigma factor (sigma-70 family)